MPNPLPPRRFVYNEKAMRFQDARTKQFASEAKLRDEFDAFAKAVDERIGALTKDLYQGGIRVEAWQTQVSDLIRTLHVSAAALGAGGWNRMTPTVRGRVGQRLRFQYERLEDFAKGIADRSVSEPQALARGSMYANAGYSSWQEEVRAQAIIAGKRQERNVLGAAEHCSQCVEETNKGWVKIGTLVKIGARICLSNCRCRYLFQ
jgi:hypothetical protein